MDEEKYIDVDYVGYEHTHPKRVLVYIGENDEHPARFNLYDALETQLDMFANPDETIKREAMALFEAMRFELSAMISKIDAIKYD
jgi:ABC-type multidrug transport system ATPase subunit